MSSRWYGLPGEYALRKKGMSTVGVLVYLDGSHPFRSWDGDMVRARVYFSVDGRLVHVSPGLGPPIAPDGSSGDGSSSAVFPDEDPPAAAAAAAAAPRREEEVEQVTEYVPSPLPGSASIARQLRSEDALAAGVDGGEADEGDASTSESEEVAPWEAAAASAVAGARAGSVNGGCFGGVMDEESGAIVNVAGTEVLRKAVPASRARKAQRSVEGGAVVEEGEIGEELASLPVVSLAPGGSAALGLALPKDRDLFPTVTIHSAKTEVMLFCYFCVLCMCVRVFFVCVCFCFYVCVRAFFFVSFVLCCVVFCCVALRCCCFAADGVGVAAGCWCCWCRCWCCWCSCRCCYCCNSGCVAVTALDGQCMHFSTRHEVTNRSATEAFD